MHLPAFGTGLLLNGFRRALGHELSAVNDADSVRHPVRFVHVMRGQKYRDPFRLIHPFHNAP